MREATSIRDLVRPHVASLAPYVPIKPFEVVSAELGLPIERIIKLDANENPYGPIPAVADALARYPFLHIYPDPEQRSLRVALSEYAGVSVESVLAGAGADELIDLVCRIFLDPGDAIIDCPPTFGMYRFDAGLAGAGIIRVPRRGDFSLDLEGIEQAVLAPPAPGKRPKILFVTSPNNPDGGLLDRDALHRLLALPILVVLDEAYIEFAGCDLSSASLVASHENLVVLRTLSKWAGLAGLRVGYGIFPDWLMPLLWRCKQPYGVSVAAMVSGLVALGQRDAIQKSIDALIRERERLINELGQLPFLRPYPSQSNFVLCRVDGIKASVLRNRLAARGILVRHYAEPDLDGFIRVSAGKPEHTDALLAALRASASESGLEQ